LIQQMMTFLLVFGYVMLAFHLIQIHPAKVEEFVPPSKPDFESLEKIPPSKITSYPEFVNACKEMAGYYKDSTKNPLLKNTIFIAGINYSYRDFFHNFRCYTDRLGIKFLPISLDPNIYSYIKNNNIAPTFLMPDVPGRGKVLSEASGFGGKNFNLIGCRKIEAVAGALALGYNVVFSDVDIAILRDPIHHLFFPGVDYVHSENIPCGSTFRWRFNHSMEGNTGFYSVRSNPQTIRTWDLTYRACSQTPLYDDQTMFWLILRNNLNPIASPLPTCPAQQEDFSHLQQPPAHQGTVANSVVSCPLNSCLFSAGGLRSYETFDKLKRGIKLTGQLAVTAHANWMNGRQNKQDALTRTGLWLAKWQPAAQYQPQPLQQQVQGSESFDGISGMNHLNTNMREKSSLAMNHVNAHLGSNINNSKRMRQGRKKHQQLLQQQQQQRRLQSDNAGNWTCRPITSPLLKTGPAAFP